MSSSGKPDLVSNLASGTVGLAILICIAVFALDRCQAALAPDEHAAEQATRQAERDAEAAHQAEVQRIADVEKAKRDEAQQKEEVTYLAASESFENFKSTLRDPKAARFSNVWAVRGKVGGFDVIAACGVVNAPNALGAYVGDTPFIAAASYIFTPEHPSFADRFQSICLDGEKVMKLH